MESKKSPEADLERHHSTRLLVGYVVALSILFVALEWSVPEKSENTATAFGDLLFEEQLDIPLPEAWPEPPPPPPADKPEAPAPAETITLVDDDAQLEETPPPLSLEATDEAALPEVLPTPAPPATDTGERVFLRVDELPEFPDGGVKGLMRYLTRHIQYPLFAQRNRIQGRVLCQFIVNADGSIADVEVMTGVHPVLDHEAARVLRGMPRWKPGKLKGQPVRVRYTLPVEFRLR